MKNQMIKMISHILSLINKRKEFLFSTDLPQGGPSSVMATIYFL